MGDDHVSKHILDDGYTIRHADGSTSTVSRNLLSDGYTIWHDDGTRSTVSKNLLDDGYTIHHPGGARSTVSKNLLSDGYTIRHAGASSSISRNLLDDGYTIRGGLPRPHRARSRRLPTYGVSYGGGVPKPSWPTERGMFPALMNAVVIIGGIGLVASFIATPWALTTFQVSDGAPRPYGRGLHLLLRVAFVTGASAVAASWAFTIIARLARQVTSAFAERTNTFLVAAGVLPPLTMFVIGAIHDHRGGHLWLWAGGTVFGPPKWFWLIGPTSLTATHVIVLAGRAARFGATSARRRFDVLAVVIPAMIVFVAAGFVVDWGIA